MTITFVTLFPQMFEGPLSHSIVKKAQEAGTVTLRFINIRDFGLGNHQVVDDKPIGGGTGMVLRVDVLDQAIQHAKLPSLPPHQQRVILLDARGQRFTQQYAQQLTSCEHLIFVCGHYEGVDERVRSLVDETISIGDFIVTGGEIPAMLISDAIVRLLPTVLKEDATTNESFTNIIHTNGAKGILEYPQYTLPRTYKGDDIPSVLLSGNHKHIETWRQEQAEKLTTLHRPDLIVQQELETPKQKETEQA